MNTLRKAAFPVTAMTLALFFSAGVSAQSTWNVYNGSSGGSGCTQNAGNSGSYNNSWGCTSATGGTAGTTMTASAWSTDRGTGVFVDNGTGKIYDAVTVNNAVKYQQRGAAAGTYASTSLISSANWKGQELTISSGSGFASAYMSSQGNSGFGAASRTEGLGASSPDHSFDSFNPGTTDMMLIDFGSTRVVLDKIGIGWTSGDADITVMRWTGTSAPTRISGSTGIGGNENLTNALATQTTAGWQLVGSYNNLLGDNSSPFGDKARSTGATEAQASSWWLISTFNTTLNGGAGCKNADGSSTTCDTSDDTFKLNYIATKPGGSGGPTGNIPEPTSLALAFAALAGVFGVRRRVSKTG